MVMTPTSSAQAAAAAQGRIPPAEEVRPGLWALPSAVPGAARIPFSFIWILQDSSGGIMLVDAGYETPENREDLARHLGSIGATLDDVRTVVITHLHPDHVGMARWLRDRHGAELVMGREEVEAYEWFTASSAPSALQRWGVPDGEREVLRSSGRRVFPALAVDRTVDHGDVLHLGGSRLRVEVTPGHTRGHIVLVDDAHRQIYTGDHVLPTMHPGIGIGGPSDSRVAEPLSGGLPVTPAGRAPGMPVAHRRATGRSARAPTRPPRPSWIRSRLRRGG